VGPRQTGPRPEGAGYVVGEQEDDVNHPAEGY